MKRRVAAALYLAATGSMILCARCGGTSGREGLPVFGDSVDVEDATTEGSADAGGGVDADATTISDANNMGAFDVMIYYADRRLPDVSAPVEASADAAVGYPWPACPPFVPVINGKPSTANLAIDEVPGVYDDAGNPLLDDAGNVVVFSDASACGSYGWLGSTAIDQCITSNNAGGGGGPPILLPPCNWCVEAGTVGAGPRAGASRYSTCLDLYECIRRTGCGLARDGFQMAACLCGDASTTACMSPQGACGVEEMGALEQPIDPDPTKLAASVNMALLHYEDAISGKSYSCGSYLNGLFNVAHILPALPNGCFPPDAGPF